MGDALGGGEFHCFVEGLVRHNLGLPKSGFSLTVAAVVRLDGCFAPEMTTEAAHNTLAGSKAGRNYLISFLPRGMIHIMRRRDFVAKFVLLIVLKRANK